MAARNPKAAPAVEENLPQPRRSVAFIGSECYPFVKTGGLGDVMYALPKALVKQNCDVRVIIPRYKCIPEKYQEKMVYRGAFSMDLCADGKSFYVGIMEYVWDGVVYDFIDNDEFFSWGNPYTNLVDDIPRSRRSTTSTGRPTSSTATTGRRLLSPYSNRRCSAALR